MSFGDLSRSGRLQGAWEVGVQVREIPGSKLQASSSKLQALLLPHFSETWGSSSFVIQGLESRGESSGGGDSKKEGAGKGALCWPIWFLKQGIGSHGGSAGVGVGAGAG